MKRISADRLKCPNIALPLTLVVQYSLSLHDLTPPCSPVLLDILVRLTKWLAGVLLQRCCLQDVLGPSILLARCLTGYLGCASLRRAQACRLLSKATLSYHSINTALIRSISDMLNYCLPNLV